MTCNKECFNCPYPDCIEGAPAQDRQEYFREYRAKHKDEIRAQKRDWYAKNKERVRKIQNEYNKRKREEQRKAPATLER